MNIFLLRRKLLKIVVEMLKVRVRKENFFSLLFFYMVVKTRNKELMIVLKKKIF